ncbi:anti-sigma factor [Herbaspirillum sp. RV1423]|uniref:anti-sigma factor family protein n=1 Tax=Herbaspirillum sp. RV1423 TaxID=1443993 RepID=UPI0004AE1E33|nr:anti-sigma factor [Herbaspirillum sp. RV1423]
MKDKQDEELSALIQQQATRYKMDDQLRAKFRTQLLLASAGQPDPASKNKAPKSIRPKIRLGKSWAIDLIGWRNLAISFLFGVALTLLLTPRIPPLSLLNSIDEELVADHVRSLRVGPLLQVQSSDRHTVKPWFQGKLDYAPPVLDLAADDFPLLGGRVEHIDKNSIATLVYGRHGHVINLFVWPSESQSAIQNTQIKGFNLSHWSDARMQFWVVSDMDSTELARFVQLLQAKLLKL